MLIEFSLANWGSFASERTFSLVASRLRDSTPGRLTVLGDPQRTEVLTTALLLGKNGSGKSTLVAAMDFVADFVRESADAGQQGERIRYNPCKVEKHLAEMPTIFRVIFSMRGTVYQFSFSYSPQRILTESLSVADKTVRFRKLYEREYDEDGEFYRYSFGDSLKGNKSVWQSSTRDNALFISTAVQLNSKVLFAPFEWLSHYFRPLEETGGFENLTAKRCLENPKFRSQVLTFLQSLDINVHDIIVEERDFDDTPLREAFSESFLERIRSVATERKNYEIRFVHCDSDGDPVEFDLSSESTGTQALFRLAGPMFDTLNNGFCFIIDEINTNLHPLVLKALVDAFSDPALNKLRAQLVFTSHDTSLLRDHQFRRDEIWFVTADNLGRSDLVPLSDYSPRKGEALERGYLGGRYGGVPFISTALLESTAE